MPAPPAKPRHRRLVLPPLTDEQQVLFTFDDGFPKDHRKDEAERVLAARRRGQSTRVVVPDGMHVLVRARASLDWHELGARRRGRPRMPATPPPHGRWYEWSDGAAASLGPQVKAIVGDRDDHIHDTDSRVTDDGTILGQLKALAATFLERPLTTTEDERLRTLFRGGPSRLEQTDGRQRRQAKASAITHEMIAWKAGAGERNVKTYKKILEFLRYR